MWPQLLEQVIDTEACAFIHRRAGRLTIIFSRVWTTQKSLNALYTCSTALLLA